MVRQVDVRKATNAYNRRMKKRGQRKRRGKRDSTKGMLKTYRYKFALNSQVLAAPLATANMAQFVAAPAGQNPLTNTSLSVLSGTCGFPNFIDVQLACSNALTDIANIGAFTVLYDAYKITKVHCEVEYLSNIAAANANGLMPTVYYWVDRDDAVVPAGLPQILGKQGIRKWHPTSSNSRKTISYTPCQRIGVQNSNPPTSTGITPGAELNRPMWINCSQGMVPGYALKMVIVDFYSPGAQNVNNAFRFNWHYDIAFRSPLVCT